MYLACISYLIYAQYYLTWCNIEDNCILVDKLMELNSKISVCDQGSKSYKYFWLFINIIIIDIKQSDGLQLQIKCKIK